MFTNHTIESAPAGSRRAMTATASHLGYLPTAIGLMSGSFDGTSLDPVAREVLVMTMAARNGCHLCRAMHTARLTALDADQALIASLRAGEPLADPRLEAIRVFTLRVLDTAGDVGEPALKEFFARGYTERNALEVVLGIGAYTMSTLANRLTGAPIDEHLRQFA